MKCKFIYSNNPIVEDGTHQNYLKGAGNEIA